VLRSVPAQIVIVEMCASVVISVKAPLMDVAFVYASVVTDPHASVKRTSASVLKGVVTVLAMVSELKCQGSYLDSYNVYFFQ